MVDWTDEMDNVEWLRKSSSDEWCGSALNKCTDEIERLREELAAYRARKPVVYSPDAQAMSDRVKAAEAERDALREENARLREGRMRDAEREELIEKIVEALIRARLNGFNSENTARAMLAVAEPVIREQCAKIIEPSFPRPCDCETCYCGNRDDAERVAAWDEATANAKAIREGEKDE